jgi:hypothetical protein
MGIIANSKTPLIVKIVLLLLLSHLFVLSSCSQEDPRNRVEVVEGEAKKVEPKEARASHPYGGWYCPDNLFGFPAVDIDTFQQLQVITDRLPTREETRSGQSLIFVDVEKYPEARPIEANLPRLARYYNEHTEKDELIIVIQALEIGQDSVVGFRYVNGGNGSSWWDEVRFLEAKEIQAERATSFVSEQIDIEANRSNIWKVLTDSTFAKTLAADLGDGVYKDSDWVRDAKVYNKNLLGVTLSVGKLTAIWPEMYIQMDYKFNGQHFVEKVFLHQREQDGLTTMQFVAGPYGEDFENRKRYWKKYLTQLKVLSEQIYVAEQLNPLRN